MKNAFGLPTHTIYVLFDKLSMTLTHGEKNNLGAIFQRASLIGPIEDAIAILEVHLDCHLTEKDHKILGLAYKFSEPELKGLTVETLANVADSQLSANKDKVLASQAINSLYNEDGQVNQTHMDRLILNLVK